MAIDVRGLTGGALAGGWAEAAEPASGPAAGPGGAGGWLAARRHTRLVAVLRIVLPALALVVVAWMMLSARTLPRQIGNVDLGEVGLEGTTLTMQNPKLSGFNEGGTSYQVTAARALQDVTNPRTVTLQFVDGTMTDRDGATVRVTADDGVYDSDAQLLELSNNIVVVTSKGEEARLQAARVDMAAGTITSGQPVSARSRSGNIRAKSMEITERGAHLLFRGNVVVDLRLDGGPVDGGPIDGDEPAGEPTDAE